jgi:hypothetical protein
MYDYRDCARLGWAGCTRRDSVQEARRNTEALADMFAVDWARVALTGTDRYQGTIDAIGWSGASSCPRKASQE